MMVLSISISDVVTAAVAQLGERMTEDHKVRGSSPRGGTFYIYLPILTIISRNL